MELPGIKHTWWLLLSLVICAIQPIAAQQLREGDLLFSVSASSNAITEVTSRVGEMPIDHVAIVHRIGGSKGLLYVVEAIKPQVCLTPIDTFLCRNPHVLVARVDNDFDSAVSVKRCLLDVGKPYDDLYLPGDSAIYCSELVQKNFVTSSGELIFNTIPMSFHDATGVVTDYWLDFYAQHGMAVPEGLPGTNPGELSRRPQVRIIGKLHATTVIEDR